MFIIGRFCLLLSFPPIFLHLVCDLRICLFLAIERYPATDSCLANTLLIDVLRSLWWNAKLLRRSVSINMAFTQHRVKLTQSLSSAQLTI